VIGFLVTGQYTRKQDCFSEVTLEQNPRLIKGKVSLDSPYWHV